MASDIVLNEWAFNVDGVVSDSLYGDLLTLNVNAGGFDLNTGLGTISVILDGGVYIAVFFDDDIDAIDNTFYNE